MLGGRCLLPCLCLQWQPGHVVPTQPSCCATMCWLTIAPSNLQSLAPVFKTAPLLL